MCCALKPGRIGDKRPLFSRRGVKFSAAAADLHFLGAQLELQLGAGLQLLEKVLRVEQRLRRRISIEQGCRVLRMLLRVCLHRSAYELRSHQTMAKPRVCIMAHYSITSPVEENTCGARTAGSDLSSGAANKTGSQQNRCRLSFCSFDKA